MNCGQGQLRVREAPITVSRRKLPAWDGRVTAFTEQLQLRARLSARDGWSAGEARLLHSHLYGQTIKHLRTALTQAAASPRTFPARPRGQSLGSRDRWSQKSTKPQPSPKPPTWLLLGLGGYNWIGCFLLWASVSSSGKWDETKEKGATQSYHRHKVKSNILLICALERRHLSQGGQGPSSPPSSRKPLPSGTQF